ncbi:MAG: LacI family DNA-binding transcriptional regulator [Clostridia bacterium]|nr:LacI family DNA-binding transcriptional regulator [Clostridia bacterium]
MTSREFAELIGVSQATVSRALNGSSSVSEKTRIYIEQKAEEYGFVLNSQARSLKTSKTQTVGVLFPLNFDSLSKNLMFTHISDQLQRELSRRGYDIMIVYDHDPELKSNTFERVIRSGKVDGLINFRPQLLEREIDLIEKFKIPFVSLHSALQESAKLHQLMLDEENAGFQIGQYFGGQEGERYIYIAAEDEPTEKSSRLQGYMNGLASRGKKLDACLSAERSSSAAYEAVMAQGKVFRENNTSIFVYNDVMALGVVNALRDLGISVPKQAQVFGMDDIPLASWFTLKLSTMRSPVRQMVKDGCDLLIALIEGEKIEPQTVYYQAQMILRDTTR